MTQNFYYVQESHCGFCLDLNYVCKFFKLLFYAPRYALLECSKTREKQSFYCSTCDNEVFFELNNNAKKDHLVNSASIIPLLAKQRRAMCRPKWPDVASSPRYLFQKISYLDIIVAHDMPLYLFFAPFLPREMILWDSKNTIKNVNLKCPCLARLSSAFPLAIFSLITREIPKTGFCPPTYAAYFLNPECACEHCLPTCIREENDSTSVLLFLIEHPRNS